MPCAFCPHCEEIMRAALLDFDTAGRVERVTILSDSDRDQDVVERALSSVGLLALPTPRHEEDEAC